MTTHHEYMHAYFFANNITLSGIEQHKIIKGWHYDQVNMWKNLPNYSKNLFNNSYYNYVSNTDYTKYGFNLISYLP
ncbi:hypothetical protein N9887_01545 [Flavobacteriaceae bacterium]|nr:hypothetical protein [Flavobacteriaceae bacterium]